MRASPRVRLETRWEARAKDASLIASILATISPLPKWALALVPMNDLHASGETVVGPSLLEVRSLTARGGMDAARFEYDAGEGPDPAWVALVEAGPVCLAADQLHGGSQVILFNARPWFEARASEVRAHEQEGRRD